VKRYRSENKPGTCNLENALVVLEPESPVNSFTPFVFEQNDGVVVVAEFLRIENLPLQN
jgi:hypothetical protein